MQHSQHIGNRLFTDVHIIINSKLIAQAAQVFAQQAVIVERAYEVLHNSLLYRRQLHLGHLLLKLVVERGGVTIYHFLIVGIVPVVSLPYLRHLVVHSDTFKSRVESLLSFLTLGLGIEVLVLVIAILLLPVGIVRVLVTFFQSRIVVKLGRNVLLKLCKRHLEHPYHGKLLLGEPELLNLFLFLYLYQVLCHGAKLRKIFL